ncbi:hypothetical protein BDZ94DRAFT_1263406 [Collybia nuda]|uniref:Uncharacterized protein n=1 Tax=Collybia nuda TaxID=64659 RepID=A0A9P5Y3E7_9AGAR|nr:hypothetical protein BDZ94DRAFT_1263406 [Collybia nuda]
MFAVLQTLLILPLVVKCAATVTLVEVHASGEITIDPSPSKTYSIVGVGSDGLATVSFEWVESVELVATGFTRPINDGTTGHLEGLNATTTIPPRTWHGTMVADASHYALTESVMVTGSQSGELVIAESCDLDGKGGGSCIERAGGGGRTLTISRTGSVIPFQTEVFSENNDATDGYARIPAFNLAIAGSIVSIGIFFGFFIGL